jgi:hypothetical protein
VAEVITELFPMVDVEQIPGELLILGGTNLGQGAASRAGGVGNAAQIHLTNPPNSGALLTVTRIIVSSDTTDVIRIGRIPLSAGNTTNNQLFRDLRRGAVARPVGQINTAALATFVAPDIQFRLLADTPYTLWDENDINILPPGFRIQVGASATDTLLHVTYFWRERAVELSELSV